MRKLKLQIQTSIDGFVCGPKGELDWMQWNWDDALKAHVTGLTQSVDCIIMGRTLASGFIPHWKQVAENADNPEYEFGKLMDTMHKVVFSKTLDRSPWDNAELAKGSLQNEIDKLKNQPGKDIIVYGGAGFVSSLISARLIDELNFFVNPVAISEGISIFAQKTNLNHIHSQAFDCGIILNTYQFAP